ncbi:MAG TPA: alkaline phosphatase [Nannocystis sp.]
MRARTIVFLGGLTMSCGEPGEGSGSSPGASTGTSGGSSAGVDPTGTGEATGGAPTATGSDTGEPTGVATHTIGGSVRGLQGAGLELALAGEVLAIAGDGPFDFVTPAGEGASYSVTVATQPGAPDQTCMIAHGEGLVAGADVGDIVVTCVTPIRHVVVLGIDGLGGAYVPEVATPVLDGMMQAGVSTLAMQNTLPTMSAPNWMSMIVGSTADQHGVDSNEWEPGDSQPTPTIFAVLRAQRPTARIGVFHDWDGFGALVEPGVADVITSPGDEVETVSAALAWMQGNAPDLLFIHLDLVDHAGHFNGWGSDAYVEAAGSADALVGEVLAGIDAAGMRPYTAVLVSADHGGDGLSHGADTSLERPIPLIVTGPQVPAGVQLQRETRIFDIAATVAALHGLAAPASWLGSPVHEALAFVDPPDEPARPLELLPVSDYVWVYDDSGSGALTDGSIWRPVVPAGFVSVGDVAQASHDAPGFATLVIRDDPGAVREPVGYEQIWTDEGSLGDHDVTIWNPIPPAHFVCLGSVAVAAYDTPPATGLIRCVHRRYLVRGAMTLTWTDTGSFAFQDAGLWTCTDGVEGGQAARSFITRRHHSDPGLPRCWSLVTGRG